MLRIIENTSYSIYVKVDDGQVINYILVDRWEIPL